MSTWAILPAALDERFCLELDMGAQLLVDVVDDSGAAEQRAQPRHDNVEPLHYGFLHRLSHFGDGHLQAIPALLFDPELLAAGTGERIELGFAAGLGDPPTRRDPSFLLDPIERGVQGSLLDGEHFVRQLTDALDKGLWWIVICDCVSRMHPVHRRRVARPTRSAARTKKQ
jgi:hypothetical protein